MSETLKEKFDRDRYLQAYIEKLPKLLMLVQNLTTKAPLFEAGGSRLTASKPSQVLQRPRTFAIASLTFERNPDKEAEVVASRMTSIILTDLEPNLLANEPTKDEEGEDMDNIS